MYRKAFTLVCTAPCKTFMSGFATRAALRAMFMCKWEEIELTVISFLPSRYRTLTGVFCHLFALSSPPPPVSLCISSDFCHMPSGISMDVSVPVQQKSGC